MKLKDLVEKLQEALEQFGGDIEVRIEVEEMVRAMPIMALIGGEIGTDKEKILFLYTAVHEERATRALKEIDRQHGMKKG